MLDKKNIQKKFEQSLTTYNENALVQKQMANKLVSIINRKKFDKILEIGSYTGILTKKIVDNFEFKNYCALDIVDSGEFVKKIDSRIRFIKQDVEEYKTDQKFDLIISNAALQWCNDFKKTIFNLYSYLNNNSLLIVSTFSCDNLIEIKNTFNLSLDYPGIEEIKEIFPRSQIIEEKMTLEFNNPIEILRHLKKTGVNSLSKDSFNLSKLKQLETNYNNKITYKPLYIKVEKRI